MWHHVFIQNAWLSLCRFHFKGQLTIARPPTPDDSGLEDDMTVVPADTLFELLRRTFHLSQEKFHTYEHQIYRYHQRKDPSRVGGMKGFLFFLKGVGCTY